MKKVLKLIIRTESPLMITKKTHATNYIESLDYIPGTAILGAIQNQILQDKSSDGSIQNLRKIYSKGYLELEQNSELKTDLDEYLDVIDGITDNSNDKNISNLNVSDFIPVNCNNLDTNKSYNDTYPPIMSLVKCRADPNHIADSTLFQIKKWMRSKDPIKKSDLNNFNENVFFSSKKCPYCGNATKKSVSGIELQEDKLIKIGANQQAKTGITINSQFKSIAKEGAKGLLYVKEYIKIGETFTGLINFDDQKITKDRIIELIDTISIGSRRNAGYGRISVVTEQIREYSVEEYQKNLIHQMLENYQKQVGILDIKDESTLIIPFYAYSDIPFETLIELKTHLAKFDKLKIHFLIEKTNYRTIRDQIINKWHYVPVLSRGSVGFIMVSDPKQKDINTLIENFFKELSEIQINRIGLFKNKGLGEFHFLPNLFFVNYYN